MKLLGKSWLLTMLMALLLLGWSNRVSACAPEQSSRYTVMLEGTNQLRLKMPLYDKDDYDCWIVDGTVYIQIDGESAKETLFHYSSEQNISNDNYAPKVTYYRGVDGTMTHFRDRGYNSVSVGTTASSNQCPMVDNQSYAILNILWDIAAKYRGKKVEITWSIHHNGNMTEKDKWINIEKSSITIPAAPDLQYPMLMDPMISYETGRPNQMMVPYVLAASNITSMKAHYKEVYPSDTAVVTVTLPATTSEFVRVPADVCIKDFYVEGTYVDAENKTQTTCSSKIDLPILHHPKSLAVVMQPNGKALLKWRVGNVNWQDLSPNDCWEVQRNISGDPTNNQWTSLAQIVYDEAATEFTYEDGDLLTFYQQQPVYYRVRRVITAIWDWNYQSGYATTMLPGTLALPGITEATVNRNGTWSDIEHQVVVKFDEKPLPTYDTNGRLILRNAQDWVDFANMVNAGNNGIQAVMACDIDLGDIQVRVGETSSCAYKGIFWGNGHKLTVHYDLGECTAPFAYLGNGIIRDLHVAGTIKAKGKYAAGIAGNITGSGTLERCRSSVAITSTITGDATNGGLVGVVSAEGDLAITYSLFDGSLLGSNCNSNSGFAGWVQGKIEMDACLFAPQKLATQTASCATFSRNKSSAETSYYTVSYGTVQGKSAEGMSAEALAAALGTSYWEVVDGAVVPIKNTAAVSVPEHLYDANNFLILRDSVDWDTFVQLVKEANGEKDVNAIMAADISTSVPVGSQNDVPYRGTFNGNGHTLTVNIDGGLNAYTAPFVKVSNCTIQNLRVCGTVNGGIHSSGLIGHLLDKGVTAKVYNCHISTNVTGSGDDKNAPHQGGIIGHGHSSKCEVQFCLFDGTITANNATNKDMGGSWVGALVGWEDGGTNNYVENNLEMGSYINYKHNATCANAKDNGHPWGSANNYNSNYFGESHKTSGMTPDQIASALGDQWHVVGGSVLPIITTSEDKLLQTLIWDDRSKAILTIKKYVGSEERYIETRELTSSEYKEGQLNVDLTTACVDHELFLSVEQGESTLPLSVQGLQLAVKTDEGEDAVYKFDNNVLLGKAQADTLQSSVSLSWECTRGYADYFRIKRYDKLNPDEVTMLEDEYTEMAYIDRTVRPQHSYTYIIEGVTQCEGNNVSTTTVDGCCVPTGMVRGYVRLANGVGLPNYTVTAKPMDTIVGGEILTTVTDSTGFFEIGGLIYQKYGEYSLSVTDPSREASFESQIVTFDEDVNLQSNIVFTQQNYYLFSGYVLYDGSSIPVSGVRFLRDGVEVVNSNGKPVTTNNQGAFEVSIPQGSHQIQIVKEGHVFQNDGFYITEGALPDSTWHNWQKNVSGVYMWDNTKVNLMGRVVGGNIQGTKELGKSLSTNNLGDNITMVVQLEGDNTSWIVRDQLNSSVTERHSEVPHGVGDTTRVDEYRHRIVIHPDVKTGEYCLPMYPVKFKVTEIYADGYSTLFQTGMVSETVDLNGYANGDTAVYSRIYHAQPTLDIWQFNGTQDRYYGLKQYTAMDNAGIRDTVTLWRKDETGGIYTLGYPVFMADASVPMVLSAREEYRYNNDEFGNLDIVQLEGGHVIVGNGLVGNDRTDELDLDSVGQGSYVFTPKNLTFMLEDQMALRTLKFTLEYDGSFYDIAPINAYVMASQPKAQGRRIIAGQNTHLVDILRDPPGASSSAYIAKGSKMSYSYTADYTVTVGLRMTVGTGVGADFFSGIWAGVGAGSEAGTVSSSDNIISLSYDLATAYYQDWSYEYEFTTNEKISTSSNVNEVGMNSDVYIGVTDNVIVEDAVAVRAVNSAALARLRPGVGGTTTVNGHDFKVTGTAKVLARGWDPVKNDSVYLIRDEVMQLSSKINSTFAHSQKYLMDELIPTLIRTRNALLLDSTTTSDYAQAMADKQKKPVYVSKVATDSENFAQSDNYDMYKPTDSTDEWPDSIQALNTQIQTWAGFIAANEKEKIEAHDLLRVYDFDGRSSVDYSESFTTSSGEHCYWKLPTALSVGGDGLGGSTSNGSTTTSGNDEDSDVSFKAGGIKFSLRVTPLFSFDFNYKNGMNEGLTKETGFNLSCARQSNLSVGVYKTRGLSSDSIAKLAELGEIGYFYQHVEDNLKDIYNGRPGSSNTTSYIDNVGNVPRYRNFVFRTLAGATCSPWEEERRTMFYNPGTILDHGTEQINKLRIWAKEPSVSNVPYGEPARFTIYLVNESDLPERVSHKFNVYSETGMNPKGAKIYIDGAPLTTSGIEVWLEANEVVEKQVEVYAGSEYDYENLGISLFDEEDYSHIYTVNLSAHYVPAAGAINISKPGDKWVVNTESAYDEEQMAYYLPVHIDGFDVNFRNFDHIELQYKLSNQGDKDWVNICSYYRNNEEGEALMALASGEKQLMEHDGYIDAFFYGETDPVEQTYDIRAVTFCRHGNGYLTRSSNILTGIKDTRRPQVFGTPQPVDGILGIGDDIILRFSEQIASNYLSAVNNFQVVGQTNSSNISLSSSLRFNGKDVAFSQAPRNLEGRSFTVDVMLNPEHNGKGMTILSHGKDSHALELGLTEDHRLTAAIKYNDTIPASVFTASEPCTFDGLREVFFLFDTDIEEGATKISFYDGNTQVGSYTYPGIYQGSGNIVLGKSLYSLLEGYQPYTGDMLEYRLWNHALADEEMNSYRQKQLTGYELGLLDNYPLNEGSGDYSYNRTSGGSDLALVGTSWKMPDGIGMKLDGSKGFRLNNQQFNRYDYQDYTMMFWFRTKDAKGTLFSNGTATTELGAKSHFNFAVEDSTLVLNLSGLNVKTNARTSDGKWHHVALTINRSRNVGSLYFDNNLTKTFAVDTIGGISGNLLAAGATYLDANTVENAITGNIDEIAMYEMALTPGGIKRFSSITPSGEEKGMLAYLNFSKNERQMSNEIKLVPSGVSLRRYKDTTTGEFTSQCDTIVDNADVMRLYDTSDFAPMHDTQTLENIKFSYVADGKDLLVNLDVPDANIEKTNVYIVVNDVADMQGNIMASPTVLDLYVYRNPLRWSDKRIRLETSYGETQTFEATVKNLSGKTRNFTLQGLPLWMTASTTSGSVGALDEETITFTISPYTNIGDYEEVIYLVGEDDLTEPLPITLKVRGSAPEWAVDEDLLHTNITMNLIGQVKVRGTVASDPDDMLAVFNEDHRLLGVAHLVADDNSGANDGLAYLNIYNNNYAEIDLYFEFFDASTGIIHRVLPDRTIKFKYDTIVGNTTNPVLFAANNGVVQAIPLKKGWNWVSFNVEPPTSTVKSLLNSGTKWEVGDALEAERQDGSYSLLSYKASPNPYDPNNPIYAWDCADSLISVDAAKMYRFYSNSNKIGYIYGFAVNDPIVVKKGWNRIGFISEFNLPVGTALAQYTEMASDGDIIKSQSEFAILSVDALGNKQWKGTLEYMRVGEGYMLKRNQDNEVKFNYPVYFYDSRYNGNKAPRKPAYENVSGRSMTVVAVADGVEVQPGDRLTAYRGAEVCGIAEADEQGLFYLTVGDNESYKAHENLTFTIERDDELVAVTTRSQIGYVSDAALGTPDEPTAISFLSTDQMYGDGWYSISGIKLNKRPTKHGIYIHNNEKIVIK